MREFVVGKNEAGQRLDRWMAKALPGLPGTLAQKYLRKKRVRRNGKVARGEERLVLGDVLHLYLNDELFEKPDPDEAYRHLTDAPLDVCYEDAQLLLVNKPAGLLVHPGEGGGQDTLIGRIQAYLYKKKAWKPEEERSFAPALCHRIDRNTQGLVLAAKTAQALRVMNEKFRAREVEKRYLCVVHGRPSPRQGELRGYLQKDSRKNEVHVSSRPLPGGRSAVTRYRVLESRGELSLLECELLTGRTHQIRAQLAAAGYPLLGDGKYGRQQADRSYGQRGQALCAYALGFAFRTPAGEFSYLDGRRWQLTEVDFAARFFPAFSLSERGGADWGKAPK